MLVKSKLSDVDAKKEKNNNKILDVLNFTL